VARGRRSRGGRRREGRQHCWDVPRCGSTFARARYVL
jgi:hypothetical protein